MKNNGQKKLIISLGGSVIVPDEIDTKFLKGFQAVIVKMMKRGLSFVIITGGGKTARKYAQAAQALGELNPTDLDWLGIHSTRLNGHLLRTIFRKYARPRIITNPNNSEELKNAKYKVIIAAGHTPGSSTDLGAVILAKYYGVKEILNLSNIDYVYNHDPKKYKSAKPLKNISWEKFRQLVGSKWDPGLHAPFDPVASKLAQKLGIKVVVMKGKNFKNFENYLLGKKFKGTTINN